MIKLNKIDKDSLLFRVMYNSRLLSRSKIESIDFNDPTFLNIDSLRTNSSIILGLSIIFKRKKRFILVDCQKFLSIMHNRTKPPRKSISTRQAIQESSVNSAVHEIDPKIAELALESVGELSQNDFLFDNDFPQNGIEEARNSSSLIINNNTSMQKEDTSMHDGNFNDGFESIHSSSLHMENNPKRLKLVEDRVTEKIISSTQPQENHSLQNSVKAHPIDLFPSLIMLNKEILSFFDNQEKELKEQAVARNSSTLFEMEPPQFEMNFDQPVDSFQEFEKSLDLSNIVGEFNFNEAVSEFSAENKAASFYSILREASLGEIKFRQKIPYGDIYGVRISNVL